MRKLLKIMRFFCYEIKQTRLERFNVWILVVVVVDDFGLVGVGKN